MGLGSEEDAWTKQLFVVRQLYEKCPANGKDVFCTFMDLEKANDMIDLLGRWQMLRVYGVQSAEFLSIVGRVSGWEMM